MTANPIIVKFTLNSYGILTWSFTVCHLEDQMLIPIGIFLRRDIYINVKASDIKCIATSV